MIFGKVIEWGILAFCVGRGRLEAYSPFHKSSCAAVYFAPAQTRLLLASYCRSLALGPPDADDLAMADSLQFATPGDFAAAARQHRFQPFQNDRGLLHALSAESELKTNRNRQIGFL